MGRFTQRFLITLFQYGKSVVYLIYGWVVALFFLCVIVNILIYDAKYIVYFTDQTLLLLTIACLYQAITSTIYYVKYKNVDTSRSSTPFTF